MRCGKDCSSLMCPPSVNESPRKTMSARFRPVGFRNPFSSVRYSTLLFSSGIEPRQTTRGFLTKPSSLSASEYARGICAWSSQKLGRKAPCKMNAYTASQRNTTATTEMNTLARRRDESLTVFGGSCQHHRSKQCCQRYGETQQDVF